MTDKEGTEPSLARLSAVILLENGNVLLSARQPCKALCISSPVLASSTALRNFHWWKGTCRPE